MAVQFFVCYKLHKAFDVGVYTVDVKEFGKSVEIKLFPPVYISFVQVAALDNHFFRTGAFPIAYKLNHAETENYSLRCF